MVRVLRGEDKPAGTRVVYPFFGYEYHDRHISDVLRTLGRRCDDIIRTAVETRTDHYYGRTVSCFMDEFIGYDLSHEQVRDAKECRLRKHGKTTTKRTPTITN